MNTLLELTMWETGTSTEPSTAWLEESRNENVMLKRVLPASDVGACYNLFPHTYNSIPHTYRFFTKISNICLRIQILFKKFLSRSLESLCLCAFMCVFTRLIFRAGTLTGHVGLGGVVYEKLGGRCTDVLSIPSRSIREKR